MNNEQFRRLVLDKPSSSPSSNKQGGNAGDGGGGSSRGSGTPLLGSRMRSNIPMTPRSITGVDFARQLAEHRRESSGQPPTKKFKSSAAPKGTKYAAGFQDRSLARRQQETEDGDAAGGDTDDRERRVQALEEMVKLGQIDQATFEKLRADIGVGGDVKSTHLVKGLDWELLQRVKAGEDITKEPEEPESKSKSGGDEVNVDEEFERVLDEKEDTVRPVEKEEKVKKSSMPPPPAPGQKKTRDQILKELKASRLAAQKSPEPPGPTLGNKFKKIGDGKGEKKRWIEKDEKGRRREVLLTTDAEGKTKRKVRWIDKPGEQNGDGRGGELLMPDKESKPLGMEVPANISEKTSETPQEEEDDNIFEGVGAEYNPLADIGGDESSSSSSESEGEVKDESTASSRERRKLTDEPSKKDTVDTSSSQPKRPQNYFSSTSTEPTSEEASKNPFSSDPTILAALKRAANIRQSSPSADDKDSNEETDADSLRRQKKFLEEARKREMQDAMDMDIGFGGSRFGDEEDEEGALWADEKSNKRKRGPKKRKGDKDSAGDVMKVLEGRKKEDKGKEK